MRRGRGEGSDAQRVEEIRDGADADLDGGGNRASVAGDCAPPGSRRAAMTAFAQAPTNTTVSPPSAVSSAVIGFML